MNCTILIFFAACILCGSGCDQRHNEQTEQRAVRPTTPKSLREQLTGTWFAVDDFGNNKNDVTHYWIEVDSVDTIVFSVSEQKTAKKRAFALQDSILIIEGRRRLRVFSLTDSTLEIGPAHDSAGTSLEFRYPWIYHRIQ